MTLDRNQQQVIFQKIITTYPTIAKLKRGLRKLSAWLWTHQASESKSSEHILWVEKLQIYVLMVNILRQQGVEEQEALTYSKNDKLESYEQEFSISYPDQFKIES